MANLLYAFSVSKHTKIQQQDSGKKKKKKRVIKDVAEPLIQSSEETSFDQSEISEEPNPTYKVTIQADLDESINSDTGKFEEEKIPKRKKKKRVVHQQADPSPVRLDGDTAEEEKL